MQKPLPTPRISPSKPPVWKRVSVVWLVPILALVIAMVLAWQDFSRRGQLIEIVFQTANGIKSGETEIKYKDVTVGTVEDVTFSADLSKVLVSARIQPLVMPYLDEDARFWVVQPEISLRGVTGLDTVLSGTYIEGSWDATPGTSRTQFEGLRQAPLIQDTEQGLWVALVSGDGNQISSGAPILHRGVSVGYLDAPRLDASGNGVIISAFIESPHDRLITSSTRFWDTSGFSISLGGNGVQLDVSSLAALIEGGVAFDTVVSGGEAVVPGTQFTIFPDQDQAREDAISGDTAGENFMASVLFDGSLAGLTVGSEVRFKGLTVGQVSGITPIVERTGSGGTVQLMTSLSLRPDRMGIGQDDAAAFFAGYVERGLRAQLATNGLLSTELAVELVEAPDADVPIALTIPTPYPVIPALPAVAGDLNVAAGGLLTRLSELPVEALMQSAIDLLDSLDVLASASETQAIPKSTLALVEEARQLVGSDDVAQIPATAAATLATLNEIVTRFQAAEGAASLVAAVNSAASAASNISTASAQLPAITADLAKLSNEASGISLITLAARAEAILTSFDALIDQDTTRALPQSMNESLASLRNVLDELDADLIAKNIASAADAVALAAKDLPALTARLDRMVQTVEDTLDDYGEGARFNAEATAMMRDIRSASDAVENLARTLQRNPNAILTGR